MLTSKKVGAWSDEIFLERRNFPFLFDLCHFFRRLGGRFLKQKKKKKGGGAAIKGGAWSEKVENEWLERGAPKGKRGGMLSAKR